MAWGIGSLRATLVTKVTGGSNMVISNRIRSDNSHGPASVSRYSVMTFILRSLL